MRHEHALNLDDSEYARRAVGMPPTPRFLLRRDAVTGVIDHAAQGQLVVLRGPTGLGKTISIAHWAQEQGPAFPMIAWVSIPHGADREQFWGSVGRTISASASWSFESGARELFAEDGRAGGLPGGRGFLVLDDLHNANFPELADDMVDLLLRSPHLTVIAAARAKTALESARVASRVDARFLDATLLEFAFDDVAALLNVRGIRFESALVERLVGAFGEGLPEALNLAASYLSLDRRAIWRADEAESAFAAAQHDISARLFSTVRSAPEWRALTHSAALPFLTVGIVESLLEQSGQGEEFLHLLEEEGLGRWRRAGSTERFVLGPLVRRLLLQSLLATEDRSVIDAIRITGARELEMLGEPADALALAADASDWAGVSHIVQRNYAELLAHSTEKIEAALLRVPTDIMRGDPWLLFVRASLEFSRGSHGAAGASATFAAAESAARAALNDAAGLQEARLRGLQIAILRRSGAYGRSSALAHRVRPAFDALEGANRAEGVLWIADADSATGAILMHDGDYVSAISHFTSVARDGAAGAHLRIQAAGYISLLTAVHGDMQQARVWLETATADAGWRQWRHTVWAVPVRLASAMSAIDSFDSRRARLELKVIDALGCDTEDWPLVAYVTGMLHLVAGRGFAGFSAIRDMETHFSGAPISAHFQGMLCVVKSDLLLSAKQARAALSAQQPFAENRETIAGAHARALLFLGRNSHALMFAERWSWRDDASPRICMELQLVKATAAARLGDSASAVLGVDRALAIGRSNGLKMPWSLVPREELLVIARKASPEAEATIQSTVRVFSEGLTVPRLSKRETLVLSRLTTPSSLDAIARELIVSTNTVKTQVRSIYKKLGVSSRADAVRVAHEWRLI